MASPPISTSFSQPKLTSYKEDVKDWSQKVIFEADLIKQDDTFEPIVSLLCLST